MISKSNGRFLASEMLWGARGLEEKTGWQSEWLDPYLFVRLAAIIKSLNIICCGSVHVGYSRNVSLWEQTPIHTGNVSTVAQYELTRLTPMSPEVTCILLQQNKHCWWESRGGLHGRHRRDIKWGVNRQKRVQITDDVMENQKSRTCWNITNMLSDKPSFVRNSCCICTDN